MRHKRNLLFIIIICVSVFLLYGCAGGQRAENKKSAGGVQVETVTEAAESGLAEEAAQAETEAAAAKVETEVAAVQDAGAEEATQAETERAAETADEAEEDDVVTILCYGDSNTYGYDPRDGDRYLEVLRWTTLLQEKLGEGYEVINEGRNGRTTAYDVPGVEGMNGLDYFVDYISRDRSADLIVFMLGSNDFFQIMLSAEDIRDGMENLITAVEEVRDIACGWNPKIMIIAPPLIDEDTMQSIHGTPATFAAEKSQEIVPLYEELAKKHDCLFLDVSQSLEVSELDGLHLSEEGHRQMAELVYEALEKYLQASP